jgi:hypothetical protein
MEKEEVLRLDKYVAFLEANDIPWDWFDKQPDGTYKSPSGDIFTVAQIKLIAKSGGFETMDETGRIIDLDKDAPDTIHIQIL